MVVLLALARGDCLAATPSVAANSKLAELSIDPGDPVLTGARATQRLLVTGNFDNGRQRDVTSQCRFESSNVKVATISAIMAAS